MSAEFTRTRRYAESCSSSLLREFIAHRSCGIVSCSDVVSIRDVVHGEDETFMDKNLREVQVNIDLVSSKSRYSSG